VSWSRALVAAAIADVLKAAQDGTDPTGPHDTASVFAGPPETLNAPAIVVAHPTEVRYAVAGLSIDEATLPIVCVGSITTPDVVDDLVAFVRRVTMADPTLGGVVPTCSPTSERNWRGIRVGGVDLLAAEVVLTVQT